MHSVACLVDTRPPDRLLVCRPARPGPSNHAAHRVFVTTCDGTDTIQQNNTEDDISFADTAGARPAGAHSAQTQTPSISWPDDLQDGLAPSSSYGTKMFGRGEMAFLVPDFKLVKDPGGLLTLRAQK